MTDYTPISDIEVDPDAPIPSLLGYRWRDNPIAMFEGASGAPRILADAFPDFAAGTVEIINWTMPAGSNFGAIRLSGTNGTDERDTAMSYHALKAGTLRLSVEINKTGAYTAGSDGIRLYKNGTLIASLNGTTSWAMYTSDFTFAASDLIEARVTVSSVTSQSGTTSYRNLRLLGDQRGLFRL